MDKNQNPTGFSKPKLDTFMPTYFVKSVAKNYQKPDITFCILERIQYQDLLYTWK